MRRTPAPLLCLAALLFTPAARASGVDLATGVGAAASTWKSDAGPRGWGLIGYRFNPLLVLEGSGQLGYAPVDKRVLVTVGLGASLWAPTGRLQPVLRLTILHQHEEPRDAVRANVFESILGVGDGIRHRAGLEAMAGLGAELGRSGAYSFTLGAGARGSIYPDDRGPRWYAGGDLWLSVTYDLQKQP